MPYRILVSLSIFCWFALLSGQTGRVGFPPIYNYNKKDYQAETQNWSIQQDNRGLIYFGNNLGLLEFDGNNWNCIPLPNKSIVRSIAIDSSGIVYAGGQDELGYFEANQNGQLTYHSLKQYIPEGLQNFEDVWKIFITREGIFWGTYNTIFLQQDKSFKVYQSQSRFENLFFVNQQLYVHEAQVGVKIWEGDSLRLIESGDFFANSLVTSILPHPKGGMLIITRASGVYHYQAGIIEPWGDIVFDYLKENHTYCAAKLKNGNFAIGTSYNGIITLDQEGNPLRIINKERGLLNNSVLSILQDRSGGLWLGLENGISYVEIQSPFTFIDAREGIKGSGYTSIVHEDHLYMATNQGIYLKKWINAPQTIISEKFSEVENSKSPTWALEVLDGNLLAGQHFGASEIQGNKMRNLYDQTGVWKFMQLRKNPNLALVGTYDGLLLFRKSPDGNSWQFQSQLEGIDLSCRVMEEDKNGAIWISHAYRGVYKVDLNQKKNAIESVSFYSDENGLPSKLGINVVEIQGEILFTTEKGVYSYDAVVDSFIPHQSFNELLGGKTIVYRLIEDEVDNIWFSAGDEFGRLNISNNIIETQIEKVNFNQLQSSLIKGFQHIYAFDENHIIIGVDDGFILYQPQRDERKKVTIPIHIREVRSIGPEDSLIFGGTFVKEQEIVSQQPENKIPSFPATMSDFRISYSAIHFENLNEVTYQYLLEGKDATWSLWDEKTEKEYTNLSPGKYIFKVKARNTYGQESDIALYRFSIQSPWYETVWARIMIAVIFLGLFTFILYLNTQRIKKGTDIVIQEQAKTIKKKEAEFKREVEKSEAEIIRLKNEKLEAEVVHKNKELASYALHLGQKSEMLLNLQKHLKKLKKEVNTEDKAKIEKLVKLIDHDIRLDKNWEQFEHHFDQVHEQFMANLRAKYPVLTPKDQRLCAYLRMNLSTKEIAPLMGISVRGVEISRYRLRKKLELDHDTNLTDFIMNF
jgi:ligand-binding sensor domain-containing protein/DNA-binding CsgD family transcriptional regulator